MAQLELWNKGSKGHSWHGSLEGSGGDLVQLQHTILHMLQIKRLHFALKP